MELLLNHQENAKNSKGHTPFILAAIKGRGACSKVFIYDRKVDVNSTDQNGTSALGLAIINANTKCVKYLLKAGASVDKCDKRGTTALGLAKEKLAIEQNRKERLNEAKELEKIIIILSEHARICLAKKAFKDEYFKFASHQIIM